MPGLTYSLNGSLIDRRIERDFGGVSVQKSFTYSGTAQFDYRDGQDGRRGTDRVTVNFNYSGPYDDGLLERSPFLRATATWSHAITDRLSSVATVEDILPVEFRTSTFSDTAVTHTTNTLAGPRIKLALTYSLGRPGQPQRPAPPAPSIPLPESQ
jgi:hypothetical protein